MTPSFAEAMRVWWRIGLLSFGGPAAQIALMHREVVEERGWLTEKQYLNALSFCMFLPGPEAMQLATYAGWRLHGVRGGLAAGLAFVLPGAVVVLILSMIYAAFGQVPLIAALFLGVKAAVLVIVIEALLRISKRALKGNEAWVIAVLAFIGIFFLALPFPLIVLAAAIYGFFGVKETLVIAALAFVGIYFLALPLPLIVLAIALYGFFRAKETLNEPAPVVATTTGNTLRTIGIWLAVWIVPLAALAAALGKDHLLTTLGWFFSKLAVVTFGGAYAVLAYMGQDVVTRYGWLEAGQMMDGLGLAETTPGPLILVTEFVGYTAAHNAGGLGLALAGAAVALWATFAPCFLWIFAAAPYVEWINAQPRLRAALSAITAAVVGVIANLALWFALHVFFADVTLTKTGPLTLWLPDVATLDWRVVVLAVLSGWLLLLRHWSVPVVLAVSAGLALAMSWL